MTAKVIVLVADRDDPKHGEIVVVDTTTEAERLVETLLDAGFDRERVRVFSGTEMVAQVSQRPKVELVEWGLDEPAPAAAAEDSPVEEEVQPAEALSEDHAPEVDNGNSSAPLFRTPPEKSVELMPELLH